MQPIITIPGTAAVREDIPDDITVAGVYHHKQAGIGAANPCQLGEGV